ncbi:hypothetical protein [Flavobacterium sp. CLA17]|uniref:hypothetical protein n=1 Tax=Flavobacterium sp. CLA17 TaxID=2724135 RepID=UPI001492B4BC|nr:hypothetical protein [Flavobacterium sp. CLA17]QSB25242.1 hypothetical protein HAV12_012735 [Flavobacterium sp. CLA17]
METIEYFKLQAKNLYKDFKTQKSYFDADYGRELYHYTPKYFDIDALVLDFDIEEENFTLMKAQHYIANLAGFIKWTEMLSASSSALKLSKLLFKNMHKISVIEWDIYILAQQRENGFAFDDDFKLDIFETVFSQVDDHQSDGYDYRLLQSEKVFDKNQKSKPKKKINKSSVQIFVLPLAGDDRLEFIRTADLIFEKVLSEIELINPELVRKLWDAGNYIDEILLKPEMLPIDRDYALSRIDAFLFHHVIELAVETDD